MRLTLRTLLAYLDDVLEPADAQDIGKKIEESEFAANIVHRTRDVMRRLRLGAPRLSGRAAGLDMNTVAEYLDNRLADDRVADFEKVCLESDVHLAEVASCHQILAIVLGEAAEVDPGMRDRIYRLYEQAKDAEEKAQPEAAASATTAASAAPPTNDVPHPAAAAPEPAKTRKKVEVPEYLRRPEEERSWGKPVALVVLAGLLAVVLFMAIDGSWLAERFGLRNSGGPRFGLRNSGGPPTVAQADPSPSSGPAAPTAEQPSAPESADAPAVIVPSPIELQQPESVGRVNPPVTPVEPPAPAAPKESSPPPAQPTPTTTEAPITRPAEPATKPAEPNTKAAEAAAKPMPPAAVATTPKPAEKPAPQPVAPPAPANPVGRLVSNNEVLLRSDPASETWQRVAAQEMLPADQKLISLPSFRPTIALSNGIILELLGGARTANRLINQLVGTSVEFGAPGENGVPVINLEYGRIVASGMPDSKLRIAAGGRQLLLVFSDAETTMALEVCPIREEGADPEAAPPQLQIVLYVSRGKLMLTDLANGQSQAEEVKSIKSLGSKPPLTDQIPEWITLDQATPLEKSGAQFVAQHLTTDRPALLGLQELAEPDVGGRRDEVRLLAAKSLARVGDFEPLVAALNQYDPNYKTIWNDLINDLRAAIARGPETAAKVRETFERQRGEDAATLYRMLWGYSHQELRANDNKVLKELVAALDHKDMDYRALAFWNLREITGATLFYRPENTADARKPHVQKWKLRLESGQILPPPKE